MEISLVGLVAAALAVWRLTHLLVAEDGPGWIVARLRAALGSGFWGSAFGCFHCMSLWVALPCALALGASWGEKLALWLALSGAACLLERLGQSGDMPPPAAFFEGDPKEEGHELLRRRAAGNDASGQH